MCRLFGLVANKNVDIKFSMLKASTSFKKLGRSNPHGWGIGWYDDTGNPNLKKYGEGAFSSKKFDNSVEKEVSSTIIIAHVRLASDGGRTDNNAHPFVYDEWIFAHNGAVNKRCLLELLKSHYNQDFKSEPIDSEVYFRFILQKIAEKGDTLQGIKEAVKEATKDDKGANFLLSDGNKLWAYKHGKPLFYLVRDLTKPLYGSSTETAALIEFKRLHDEKAILICSEELTGNDEQWKEINEDTIISVDKNLHVKTNDQ